METWIFYSGYRLNESTCKAVATKGNLEMLPWLHSQGCPWNEDTCGEWKHVYVTVAH